MSDELTDALLTGLSDKDRAEIVRAISEAQRQQLDRKQNPPSRRRRNPVTGVLEWREELDDDLDRAEY